MYAQDYDETVVPSGLQGPWAPGYSVYWYAAVRTGTAFNSAPDLGPRNGLIFPYLKNASILGDPAASGLPVSSLWGPIHYGYNLCYLGGYGTFSTPATAPAGWTQNPAALAAIEVPADTIVFQNSGFWNTVENRVTLHPWAWPPSNRAGGVPTAHARHNMKTNVAFADGHAKAFSVQTPATIPNAAVIRNANLGFVTPGAVINDAFYNGRGTP